MFGFENAYLPGIKTTAAMYETNRTQAARTLNKLSAEYMVKEKMAKEKMAKEKAAQVVEDDDQSPDEDEDKDQDEEDEWE